MTTEATTVEPTAGGLLDSVQVTDSSKPADNPQATEISHKAGDSGATADPAARPEYWPENFWKKDSNEPDLEGIAKSWRDLRGKISQGKHKAPEDGQYDTSVLAAGVDPKALTEYASKWGLSQAAFEELASQTKQLAEQAAGPAIDSAAEMKALGPNANAVVSGMVDWARGLVNKGVWSKDDFEEFKIMGGTARGISALMKVREAYEGRVPTNTMMDDGAPSKDELYQMVADPKYKSDPAFRNKVEKLFQQVVR
jgi:hypothetical protein